MSVSGFGLPADMLGVARRRGVGAAASYSTQLMLELTEHGQPPAAAWRSVWLQLHLDWLDSVSGTVSADQAVRGIAQSLKAHWDWVLPESRAALAAQLLETLAVPPVSDADLPQPPSRCEAPRKRPAPPE